MRSSANWRFGARRRPSPRFAAIDLGTNNCRLLVASPRRNGIRVVDAFSRIVRLGEGLDSTGFLSAQAMDRTIAALKECAEKIKQHEVSGARCIATQACRAAQNGAAFLDRVKEETGLTLEVVSAQEEAALAVKGCQELVDPAAAAAIVFDIGGGSTEISWLSVGRARDKKPQLTVEAWTSLPLGVVTLAERHGATEMSRGAFDAMVGEVASLVQAITVPGAIHKAFTEGAAHLLGTSGTMTSIAGVHLGLKRYVRRDVDGLWLGAADTASVAERLRTMRLDQRAKEPCIGEDRADLVVPGCAILEGIFAAWPASRVRVGDRGLREGLLSEQMAQWRANRSQRAAT